MIVKFILEHKHYKALFKSRPKKLAKDLIN